MNNTLYDALFAPHAGSSAPFLIGDDAAVLSYGAFLRRAAQMAHVLVEAGVSPGDRIVVQAPKLVDTLALYAGAIQVGAVYVPLNSGYTQAELAYFIGDASPMLIVCNASDAAEMRGPAAKRGAALLTLGASGGSLSMRADAMREVFEPVQRGSGDLAALLYTSGTTGRSKGAMLSHGNLLSNARVLTDHWQITEADRLVHALPIFHTHGLFVAINTALIAGAQVRLMSTFDLDAILEELTRATLMMGVPTFYTRLLDAPELTPEACKRMRLFISGSAPLLAETHAAFEGRTSHRILERYGMTETNMIASNPYSGARVAGTVGYPLPGVEVKITDPESGEVVSNGEIGMIEVRGENVFQGYWQRPEKTSEELRADGFFITGDLASQAPDGRITIVGRAKDLIISGGYNVYPKEIEDVINSVDGVTESAVFGVPHVDFGESVVAAVVGRDVDLNTIKVEVEGKLARFKHPRSYVVLDSLPRNAMGKVQKNLLRRDHVAA
ncbi:MAG: AMP-binding protein [Pseudomonadota bacterium]